MKRKDIIIIFIVGIIVLAGTVFFAVDYSLSKHANAVNQASKTSQPNDMANMPGMDMSNTKSDTNAESSDAPPQLPNLTVINIPEDQQQMIGVQTGKASIRPMMRQIKTVGRVTYDEGKLATITTKFDGYIEKLYVNATGQYVQKGQAIAEVYSPELYSTEMEFVNLLKWQNKNKTSASKGDEITNMLSKDASNVTEASKLRLRLLGITDDQIGEIERTGKVRKTLTLYSPARGYVIQKQTLQGARVQAGQPLFDVADLSTVWIVADIYEQDLPLISEGQKATISFPYYPGKTFVSRINYVYPTVNNTTRTAQVRFILPNAKGIFKPQMYSNMDISIGLGNQLSVPDSAVINTGKRQIVYVDKGNGNFEQRTVKTGNRANGMVQILSGLNAGEVVSTSANFLIDSEARLKGGSQ